MTQEQLANVLHTRQGKISAMGRSGSTWEKHWEVFLRLIRLCRDLDIDPAQDLKLADLTKEVGHAAIDKAISQTHRSGAREGKERTQGGIPARGTTGYSGKTQRRK
jgi:hypothetical protein